MKGFTRFIFIAILALGMTGGFAFAENTPAKADPAPETQSEPKVQPLTVRKQKAETEYKGILTQLTTFATRTQSALTVLADKDIDVGASQDELDAATKSLLDAKASLSLFSKIVIPETKQDKAQGELKAQSKKIEEFLRDAREHLIKALSILKEAATPAADTDTKGN